MAGLNNAIYEGIRQVNDRIKSPLVLLFMIGWLHTNYDLVLYLTSFDLGADKKIALISQYHMLSLTNMFCYPLGTALFLYFAWYFLDAVSKALMEKHGEFVKVITSRIEACIHKIDSPANKIKMMEDNIRQLTNSYSSEKRNSAELERQIIEIIKAIAFKATTGYELTTHERAVIDKSDDRYLIVKYKDRLDDYKLKELDQKLQALRATIITQYSGIDNLMAVDLGGVEDSVPVDIIAQLKHFRLSLVDRVNTLDVSKHNGTDKP